MDAKTNKTRFGTVIARMICLFLGHEREEHRDFYGFMTNGQPAYVQRFGKCLRCGK